MDGLMLDPLPIAFDEARHEYTWEPTGEQMLWSISGVVKPLSPEQREWLDKNSQYSERGTAIHKTLERFLGGDPDGWVSADFEQYTEWTDHLIHNSWWDDIEILALEHRLADPKRSIGGSFASSGTSAVGQPDAAACIHGASRAMVSSPSLVMSSTSCTSAGSSAAARTYWARR